MKLRYYIPLPATLAEANLEIEKLGNICLYTYTYVKEKWKWFYVEFDLRNYPHCCGLRQLAGWDFGFYNRTITEAELYYKENNKEAEVYFGHNFVECTSAEDAIAKIRRDFARADANARGILFTDVINWSLYRFVRAICKDWNDYNLKPIHAFTNPNTGNNLGIWMIENINMENYDKITLEDLKEV